MSEFKLPFAEGGSINRPPMFGGVNYAFWEIRMKIFMESIEQFYLRKFYKSNSDPLLNLDTNKPNN